MSAVVTAGMVGERFGQLVVVARHGSHWGQATWHAICDCGKHRIATGKHLRTGHVMSCGCAKNDGRSFRSHGSSKTAEYSIWAAMRQRCSNPNDKDWKHYGGRGIMVCERWRSSFEPFFADMGQKPPGYSIERLDVNGHYEPDNCIWMDRRLQNRNRRNSEFLEAFGQRELIVEWSEITGLSTMTIRTRLARGWSAERAVSERALPRWHPERRQQSSFQ